jgi:uncharacterized repeat protein (TIGR01451 family)
MTECALWCRLGRTTGAAPQHWRGWIAVATALIAAACTGPPTDNDHQPRPTAIAPDRAASASPVDVVIQGTEFLASATQPSGGGAPSLDTTHRAWLDEVELEAVTWIDTTALRATVPAGLPIGGHALTVQNALGERGSLDGAYTVLPLSGLAGTLSVDRPTVNLGQQLMLALTLTNTGGIALANIVLGTPVATSTDGGGTLPVGATPAPPSSMAAGERHELTWIYQATSVGHVSFAVTASAVDSSSGLAIGADVAPLGIDIIEGPVVPKPPVAPTGLTASAISQTRVDLSWNPSSGATGYGVMRGTTSGGPYAEIGASATSSYSDTTGLSPATTYYYVARATNAAGASPTSAQASARTLAPAPMPPPAPTGLAATAVSQTRIDLAWSAATGATGYIMLRGTRTGGPYTPIGTSATPSYSDTTGLSAGTTYYYVVQATSAGGTSVSSAQASVMTLVSPPPAPTGLTAKANPLRRIAVSWRAVSRATGYIVLRGTTTGGPYAQVAMSATTSFTDSGVSAGTTYYYVVQATNAAGRSPNSNQASATAKN